MMQRDIENDIMALLRSRKMENITSETLKKEYEEMGPVAYWTLYGGVKK